MATGSTTGPENLAAGTHADNTADTIRHGRTTQGERHGCVVLREADVREIRRRYAAGEYMRVIAADFGVTAANVQAITSGRSWRHLD